jgi:uncharacterized membrane protein YdjX (TVP38/TMEM64 family)
MTVPADVTEKQKISHLWVRVFLLVLLVAAGIFLLYKCGLMSFFIDKQKMAHFLESLGPWSFAGFILLQAAQVVAAPIPGDVTGVLGGYFYDPWLGVLLSTAGLTLGSYTAFILARIFGRPFVERFVPQFTLNRFNYLLHHKGALIVFLLFLIPGFPKDFLCYILGIGHLSTSEFLLIGGSGRLFGTVLLTLTGSYIRLHQYGRVFILIGVALIIVLLAMAYKDKAERVLRFWHLKNLRKRRNSACIKSD